MKSIYISPSTQEKNVNRKYNYIEELYCNKVADKVIKILSDYQIKIYRNKPEWSLSQVIEDSNNKKADIHFAIHTNAGGGEGVEGFYWKKDSEGYKFIKMVYDDISKISPFKARYLKTGKNFYGVNKHMAEVAKTTSQAGLIEIAYHDSIIAVEWLLENIDLISKTIANSIIKYGNLKRKIINLEFNIDAEVVRILKLVSPDYYKIWLEHIKNNPQVNLKGLIINLSKLNLKP